MKTVAVVGSGAMGSGIVQVAATAGFETLLFDTNAQALESADKAIRGRLARLHEKGQLNDEQFAESLNRLKTVGDIRDLGPTDIVIEAIIERLEPKQQLFAELEGIVRADAILASNTSSLSIAAIATGCARRERVCGLHFFNPVPLMKLVEVITQPATSPEVEAAAVDFSKALGKVPVVVRDGPGFLVNLGGRAYATEALHILQEGVAPFETIDAIMRDGFGFRMGPFELLDLTGIDVNYAATRFIYEGYRHDPRLKTTTEHELMSNAGRYGRKTGQGFYRYGDDAPAPAPPAGRAPERPCPPLFLPETPERLAALERDHGLVAGAASAEAIAPIAPEGEDAASAAVRIGLDPARTVAIDLTGYERGLITLMGPIGACAAVEQVAAWLRGRALRVHVIKDSPGFVLQRMLAMIANLGCEMAQIGVGTPQDIDTAMRLALNYPMGPLEIADALGPKRVHDTLRAIQAVTGSDRYRPSLWLRRRAQLGLPIWTLD